MISMRKFADAASWPRFALAFAALAGFSWLAFLRESPWTRAREAAGGRLPETQTGFPPDEPQRALDLLAAKGALGDYLLWLAIDLPFAALNFLVAAFAIALALKAARLAASPARLVLLAPALYVLCELIENGLLALFASGALAPGQAVVAVQQAATNLKFVAFVGALALGLAALAFAAGAGLLGLVRRRR